MFRHHGRSGLNAQNQQASQKHGHGARSGDAEQKGGDQATAFFGIVGTFRGDNPSDIPFAEVLAIPVIISCVVLVGTGVILAVVFTRLGLLDIGTAYLGTSPGAMSALIVLALESEAQPMLVVCFHFIRVVFVILTAPLIFRLVSGH
jgi:membrane AbrB-like protein